MFKRVSDANSYEDLIGKAALGDIMSTLALIPDNTLDLIILDPPYNVSKLKSGGDGGRFLDIAAQKRWERLVQDWDKIDDYQEWSYLWLKECQRALKDDGTMFVCGTLIHNLPEIVMNMRKLDMYIMNHIVWHKPNAMPLLTGNKLKNSHEDIVWARKSSKGKYKFNYDVAKEIWNEAGQDGKLKQMPDMWPINTSGSESVKYPCQKPLKLFNWMIRIASSEGDLVGDFFCGSGGTAVEAYDNKREFICTDGSDEAVIKTNLRLGGHPSKAIKMIYQEMALDKNDSLG